MVGCSSSRLAVFLLVSSIPISANGTTYRSGFHVRQRLDPELDPDIVTYEPIMAIRLVGDRAVVVELNIVFTPERLGDDPDSVTGYGLHVIDLIRLIFAQNVGS